MTWTMLQLPNTTPDTEGLIFVFAAVTAIVGLFVAYQAFRGYRRNESRPMLYLALGVIFLTTVPVIVDSALSGLTEATDAGILLAVTLAHLVGVSSILYAIMRA
ncbi:hypothetical protein ACFFQF_01150 [Haladaptatus pallidirubidus]|uniref:Uncharacterized protein n=1 Tax=Haladaptatus pallidirubidus TaxID=1008152 RepID=A0AAV3UC59_9EURY|nr:hypothetical protein [Haladaptatus pallidirubidus]